MMCQIYNTRNKKSRDHGGKNWQKEMLSKDLLWEVRMIFFFIDAVCVYKGDWGGGEAKIRFFFTRQDG